MTYILLLILAGVLVIPTELFKKENYGRETNYNVKYDLGFKSGTENTIHEEDTSMETGQNDEKSLPVRRSLNKIYAQNKENIRKKVETGEDGIFEDINFVHTSGLILNDSEKDHLQIMDVCDYTWKQSRTISSK